MSYGPLNFSYIVGLWTFFVNTISQHPLVRIQYNFTRMIDTKASCAYCRRVALKLYLNELWPLGFLIHMYIVRHRLGYSSPSVIFLVYNDYVTSYLISDYLFIVIFFQILTMVLPLVLIMVLPKMMNAADPDAQKVCILNFNPFPQRNSAADDFEHILSKNRKSL